MKYRGKYSLNENLTKGRGYGLLKENEAQNRVASGASAEEIAHMCYGIDFDKPAPSGQPDMKLPNGKTAEVKACKSNGTFKMELTKTDEAEYGGTGIREAAKATKPTWGQASIPNPTIRQVMLDWCAENGKDCVPFAEGVKDWYLNKADYMIAVINGECYEIPAAEITIKNNDADANAYTSYGAGPRITIIGQLPSGYEKYKV
jgi:hypothetical protein